MSKPARNPKFEYRPELKTPAAQNATGTEGGKAAIERREAFGVRGACSRYRESRLGESGSKLHALQTLRDHGRTRDPRIPWAIPTIAAQQLHWIGSSDFGFPHSF